MSTTDRQAAGPLSAPAIPVHRWGGAVSHHKRRTDLVAGNNESGVLASDNPRNDKKSPCKSRLTMNAKSLLAICSQLPKFPIGPGASVQLAHVCGAGTQCNKLLPRLASLVPQTLPAAVENRHFG
jgi:hypothetical protein